MLVSGAIYVLNGSHAAAAVFLIAPVYALVAFIMVVLSGKAVDVSMTSGITVDKNEPAELKIKTENKSRLPVPSCTMKLDCVNVLTGEKKEIPLTYSYGPKGKREGGLKLTSAFCGKQALTVKEAVITDPAGLFQHRREAASEAAVYVMPEIKKIEIPSDYLDSYDMESYTYSQRKKGQDTGEVFGIREYRDGDSPKQIHWKLSAKMDDIMVKIPSFPIENKLLVLLDNSSPFSAEAEPERKSALVELFFSLSYTLLQTNIPHSLGWVDHESGSFVMKRIENEDQMWEAVPDALGAGIGNAGASCVYKYLEEAPEERFTNHFIVSMGEPADAERLEPFGQVRVFRSE